MIVTITLCFVNIALTLALSDPGAFLPAAAKISENVTLLRLDNLSLLINESVMNAVPGFSTSFQLTHFERTNNVERPRLNETNMDPDVLKELGDETKNINQTYSMLKHWDWELNTSARPQVRGGADNADTLASKYAEPNHLSPILE